MRFWDSSAVVALCLEEPETARLRSLLESDSAIAAWWATPVECVSAFARRRREGLFTPADESAAAMLLDELRSSWLEISASDEVRSLAVRLLRTHELRVADALQLSAALVWAGTAGRAEAVSLDRRLSEAARLEGLRPVL